MIVWSCSTPRASSRRSSTAWGGRDSIDHRLAGHDDLVNAAAGGLVLAARGAVGFVSPRMLAARRAAEAAAPSDAKTSAEAAQQREIRGAPASRGLVPAGRVVS